MNRSNEYIREALRLAHAVQGKTSPNPPVGAVVVRDGAIVGRGATGPVGQSHAEIFALREAGDFAVGATMYVTLEPCCHFGRTPPCTDALIRAGIARVVAALVDPFPQVSGSGAAILPGAGIAVVPELAVTNLRPDITIRNLGSSAPMRAVAAATLAGVHRSRATSALLELLTDAGTGTKVVRA